MSDKSDTEQSVELQVNLEQSEKSFLSPEFVPLTPIREPTVFTPQQYIPERENPVNSGSIPICDKPFAQPNSGPVFRSVFDPQIVSGYPASFHVPQASFVPNPGLPSQFPMLMNSTPNFSRPSISKHEHISILSPNEQSTSTSSYRVLNKDPPLFDGNDYSSWRKRLFVWTSLSKVHPSQVAPLIFENSTGLGRTVLESINLSTILDDRPDPIHPDQTVGLAAILRVLDDTFDVTTYESPHVAFTSLMNLQRKPTESWLTFLATFQAKVRDVLKTGHKIDNTFVSYLLIQNGNMSEDDRKIIFSSLEAKNTPFHSASLEQVVATIKAVLIQSRKDEGRDDSDAFLSQSARQRFYRPDKQSYGSSQSSFRNPQQRSSSHWQGNWSGYTGTQQPWYPSRDYDDHAYTPSSSQFGSRDDRSSQSQKGKGKRNRSHSKGRGRKGGKGKNRRNYSDNWKNGDGQWSSEWRSDSQHANRRKGKKGSSKGHGRVYYSQDDHGSPCECCRANSGNSSSNSQAHPAGTASQTSSHQPKQEILYNTSQAELSDGSDFGFDCTRSLNSSNELFHTALDSPLLIDSLDASETIADLPLDSASEISDVDFADCISSLESDVVLDCSHDVFGVTGFGPSSRFNQVVTLNSFEDSDMNPLDKPAIHPERKSLFNPTTHEMQYPSDPSARELKEQVMDHYVYKTSSGVRRKYIAKGTSCEIGNIRDSPCALLDSGCTTNIGSSVFLAKYEAFLDKIGDPRKIVRKKSTTKFRFANGTFENALWYVEIPVRIGTRDTYLGLHILPNASADLLLSYPSAARMGMTINMATSAVSLPSFGIDNFRLPVANSHMYFPIYWFQNFAARSFQNPADFPDASSIDHASEVLKVAIEPLDSTDRFCIDSIIPSVFQSSLDFSDPKLILKLHLQYAHRSAEKLYKMIFFAFNKQMPDGLTLQKIRDILEKCPVCSSLRKKPVVPKFGGLLADQFNQIVAIDLLEMPFRGGKVHLVAHLIDLHSRLSFAEIIPTKEGINIVDFLMRWQMRAGRAPLHLFSDRGTEFANELVEQFCSTNGTQFHCTLQALHPEQNGINERRNGTLKQKLRFIVADLVSEHSRFSFSPRYMLDMVVFSINSQVGDSGYTPFQIAFTQPTTVWLMTSDSHPPSTWVDRPDNYHPLIADRMTLQMKISASVFSTMLMKQLTKAWKSRVYQKSFYRNGEQVYYWKRDPRYRGNGYYLGPCTVISKLGKSYALDFGSKIRRVGHNEIVAKQQLYPEEYLDFFHNQDSTKKSAESPSQTSSSELDVSRLFDHSLESEYDRLVANRDQSSEDIILEQVTNPQPTSPHHDFPSTDGPLDRSNNDGSLQHSPIILDESVDPVVLDPSNQPSGFVDTTMATPVEQRSRRNCITPSRSSQRRRPNPLLTPRNPTNSQSSLDNSIRDRNSSPSPGVQSSGDSDRHVQNQSPFSPSTARRLVFGLPSDYETPPARQSIFDDGSGSRVRFNLNPEIREFDPEDVNLCSLVHSVACRNASLYSDLHLASCIKDHSRLRSYSTLLDVSPSADHHIFHLSKLDASTSQVFDYSDSWYIELIEDAFEASQDKPMSAYREPTKDELKRFKHEFDSSKLKEIQSWISNGVFRVVDNYEFQEGDNLVTSRWLQSLKTYQSGEIAKFKSRLIIRGFQDTQITSLKKDSPTVSKISIRLLLQFAVDHALDIFSADVSTAFLQGENYTQAENRTVFVRVPKGTNELIGVPADSVWVLKKSAYGLCDAPRKWYESLMKTLVGAGMCRSLTDFSQFFHKTDGKLTGMVVTHVDDILYCGTDKFLSDVMGRVKTQYKYGSESKNSFQYCGSMISFDKSAGKITVSQDHYAQSISFPKLDTKYPSEDFLSQEHFNSFRSCLGKLNWLSTSTRPDLSYGTNSLAQVMQNPTYQAYSTLLKLVKTAKHYSHVKLEYLPLSLGVTRYILAFSDASHARFSSDGKFQSQTGSLIFLATFGDSVGWTANLIDWCSRKQKRVCRSTLCCEVLAACDTLDRSICLRDSYSALHGTVLQIILVTDCKSLSTTAKQTTSLAEKRLQVDVGSIRELVETNEVTIVHVPTYDMIADTLTKPMTLALLHKTLASHAMPNSLSLDPSPSN